MINERLHLHMKIGIVTLFGDNYGNKLQNFALQRLVESLGFEAETIRIANGYNLNIDHQSVLEKLRFHRIKMAMEERIKDRLPRKNQRDGLAYAMRLHKSGEDIILKGKRTEAFNEFTQEYIKCSERIIDALDAKWQYQDDAINKEYDAFIVGSDQVWNRTKSPFFLRFASKNKRVSFAPSFGLSELPESLKAIYQKWISDIPYLSVREEKGAEIIRALTGRTVPVLPDPTLCLTQKEWEGIEKKPEFVDRDYVLTYFLGNEINRYRQFIEACAKECNLQIINLFDMREPDAYVADPAEFVWLVHHAQAMLTDSYHGTVFSLIFHTPFIVFNRVESGGESMSSRIETLLKMVGMQDRRFGSVSYEQMLMLDFTKADKAISLQVEKAKIFLKEALANVQLSVEGNPADSVRNRKDECSGCTACFNVCPVNCITMDPDEEGFLYPHIDEKKCIHCHRCIDVCERSKNEKESGSERCYVAFSYNESLRRTSSSGGVFGEIAGQILSQGGKVYGAGFTRDFQVAHQSIETGAELAGLRGSKYVQSRLEGCFREIKDSLEKGKTILFSGTPCQVDGLLAYLGMNYENLYTQDIICHGVPSPKVWQEYLRMHGSSIKAASFRDKTYGWHYFSMRIESEKGTYLKRLDEDIYTRLFLENVTLRPSCYACAHKHSHRKADFTVADCWGGTEGINDDDKGISLLFVNTEKGHRLFEEIELNVEEIPYETGVRKQSAMTKSVTYNPHRELFFAMAEKDNMRETIQNWFGEDALSLLKRKIGFTKYQIAKTIRKR